MLALDKAAKTMFNVNTLGLYFDSANKTINKTGQGMEITADYLSSLSEEDLPKAIELLSKLYKSGEVTTSTLKKINNIVLHSGDTMSKVA
jgi:hypothetical protein